MKQPETLDAVSLDTVVRWRLMTTKYPWEDAWKTLRRTLEEERDALKKLVDDEDSACNARNLRRARMNELDNALHHMSELERWEW